MTREMVDGVLRAVLTALGGAAATHGYVSASDVQIIIGAVLALGGVAWSLWSKRTP